MNREITCPVLERELCTRFGPPAGTNFNEALKKLEQTVSLTEYQEEFERLSNLVDDWSKEALLGAFIDGLKPKLAEAVRVFEPQSLRLTESLQSFTYEG